ncbi:MAG: 2'-5' RNA ligase family protein [Micrococcaceae bacterium]
MPNKVVKERRVGVIIELPEPLASELREYRWSFGDEMAKVVPAHITLLSTTLLTSIEALEKHVTKIVKRFSPFTVELKGTDTFRPISPVVFLRLVKGYRQCMALAKELDAGVVNLEHTFPYHPHVTVAFKVEDENLDEAEKMLGDYSAEFQVTSVKVFEHYEGDVWHTVKEIPLGAATYKPT